jgi:hypothetical protein
MKIWILILASILYLAQACQNPPPKIINPDKQLLDSLIQDAKWELYKFNYHGERFLSSDSAMPKYHLPYKDTIRLVLNCDLAPAYMQKRGDTIHFYFNYFDDDKEHLNSNFGEKDKKRFYSIYPNYPSIDYVKNQKGLMGFGDCSNAYFYHKKNDSQDADFQSFIEKNRTIITNQWLLRYHDSLKLKTKL